MGFSPLLSLYPGKSSQDGASWLPLWLHCFDTAEMMSRLLHDWFSRHSAANIGLPADELEKLVRFLALVHDIGKITPVFAMRILTNQAELRYRLEHECLSIGSPGDYARAGKTPHAKAGEAILLKLGCPPGIAAVVGAHHGKTQPSSFECEENLEVYSENYFRDSVARPVWEKLRQEFFEFALSEAGYRSVTELPQLHQISQMVLTGLVIMADWLASNPAYFPLIPTDSLGSAAMYPERAVSAWEKLCLPESWNPLDFAMDAGRFTEVFGFCPNPIQSRTIQAANEAESGIIILEAQMGIGKTEAALAAAEVLASRTGCNGVFFGLPTQATANGLFPRLTAWAETQSENTQRSIRLAHGMAELNEDFASLFHGTARGNEDSDPGDNLIVHPWFSGRKQALLADFVIGTVDQLLMAALKQKHVMLRHLGLAGKVVILDECHAYDAYMNQYLDRTLNWLGRYHVPVIILSATLPEQRRAALVDAYLNGSASGDAQWRTRKDYPLLTWTVGSEVHQASVNTNRGDRTVHIENLDSHNWLLPLRLSVAAGGCCGVIVNTVPKAQELARAVKGALPQARVILLHSRFSASDRAKIEAELLRLAGKHSSRDERAGLIVIGTQVLEQSLDIDFDILITQLCPMDLLLQRLGRLHRHSRSRPAELSQARCCILDLDKESDSGSRAVYGDWLLLRTKALLPEEIYLPQSIPHLVQDTYANPDDALLQDEILRSAWEAYEEMLKDKRSRADNYRLPPPQKDTVRRVRTIDGLLNTSCPTDGIRGEAAVRDGSPSITVLIMQEHKDGFISFFPWQKEKGILSPTHVPDEETARMIVRQRITLPLLFSKPWQEEKTIRELEELSRRKLPEWQNSGWLNGELILLFNEDLYTELRGQRLRYTQAYGLILERKDDENGPELSFDG